MILVLKSFLDFLLPRFCFNCSTKLTPRESLFCSSCRFKIARVSPERLAREFERKFEADKLISGFRSLYLFETGGAVQNAIHQMKYGNVFLIGSILGKSVARELKEYIEEWNADFVAPVPIHKLRRAERGYNQSFYLARGIASESGIKFMPRLIKRKRYTSTQTTLNLAERKLNVKDAFLFNRRKDVAGKVIILVDDVITTGSTISECAKILLDNGALRIYALSAALAE